MKDFITTEKQDQGSTGLDEDQLNFGHVYLVYLGSEQDPRECRWILEIWV